MSEKVPAETPKKHHLVPAQLLHDLRTPVGHVLGYAELLREQADKAGYKELLPFIDKIHTAGEQLIALLEQNFQSIRSQEPDRRAAATNPDARRTSQT